MTIVGDTPIQEPSQDRFGRAALAESLAKQIQQADASEGLVVGVLGPWGSGKTSFVNLVRHGGQGTVRRCLRLHRASAKRLHFASLAQDYTQSRVSP